MENPLFAFFGTSVDSQFALKALEAHGLEPALVVDPREPLPEELFNTEWDFFLVASYGKMLKKEILDLPRHGCINIHPSLLPKFRGPSPYVSAILADERTTGVTLMLMEEKMDAGPILAQARIELDEADWPPKGLVLSEMLFTEGVNLLVEVLPDWLSGKLTPTPQDEPQATYTNKFADADALLRLKATQGTTLEFEDPRYTYLQIQAFDKSPRAHFVTDKGKRVVVTEAAWQDGELVIEKVLPEGKKEMSYQDYLRGQR